MAQIEITPPAQAYLAGLLAKQNCEGIAIRLFVADPGTPKAETCIAYCRPGDRKSTRLNSSHIPLSRMPSSA